MCGIFAYINYKTPVPRHVVLSRLLGGLERMEYRGYDSAGVAVDGRGGSGVVQVVKRCGKVAVLRDAVENGACVGVDLDDILDVHVGIAHTRWATNGIPCDRNAHPQSSDESHTFVVVHNGILTNAEALKSLLVGKGYKTFDSDTDTEVAAKLCRYIHDTHNDSDEEKLTFPELIVRVLRMVEGQYSFVFKSGLYPGEVVACKNGSPMVVGVKKMDDDKADHHTLGLLERVVEGASGPKEVFIASDASAIVEHTKQVLFLEDGELVHFTTEGNLRTFHCDLEARGLTEQTRHLHRLELELESIMKGKFPHFMLKEIYEQPESLRRTLLGRVTQGDTGSPCVTLRDLEGHRHVIRRARRVVVFACGTSYHSALAARNAMEELMDIPVQLELASDFQDRMPPMFRDDVCCFVSQSGETKDTLNALEYCQRQGCFLVGITNTVGSSIARKCHCSLHLNAGCEIGVASTKVYTSQILVLLLFGICVSSDRTQATLRGDEILKGMLTLPDAIQTCLDLDDQMKQLAEELKESRSLLLMGRGYQHATCLEGALKIKEVSYIHSEGIHTGELKHGPLALVDENMPVVMICTQDQRYIHATEDTSELERYGRWHTFDTVCGARVKSSLQQVLARKGRPIVLVNEVDTDTTAYAQGTILLPKVVDCLQPIVNIIPLQLLSYHLAVLRGHNVDCPRNLAKSVTV